jgi:hypothetical protein
MMENFLKLVVMFIGLFVVVSCSSVATIASFHFDDPKSTKNSVQPSDTILPANDVQRKLDDPDFDIRFERGVMQPWHDRKSVYPRRSVPLSQLAMVCNSDQY